MRVQRRFWHKAQERTTQLSAIKHTDAYCLLPDKFMHLDNAIHTDQEMYAGSFLHKKEIEIGPCVTRAHKGNVIASRFSNAGIPNLIISKLGCSWILILQIPWEKTTGSTGLHGLDLKKRRASWENPRA